MITKTTNVRTRDGRAARVLADDVANPGWPLIAGVTDSDGVERVHSYKADGRCFFSTGERREDHPLDLIPIPDPVVEYVRCYGDGISLLFTTLEEAEDWRSPNCLAIAKITFDPETMTGSFDIVRRYDNAD